MYERQWLAEMQSVIVYVAYCGFTELKSVQILGFQEAGLNAIETTERITQVTTQNVILQVVKVRRNALKLRSAPPHVSFLEWSSGVSNFFLEFRSSATGEQLREEQGRIKGGYEETEKKDNDD